MGIPDHLSMEFSRQEYWSGYFLLQGIFPTQGSNPGLLHCRQILYCLSHWGSPWMWYKDDLKKGYLEDSAEKALAPDSSTLAWKIPWMEEPGGLWSMGSLRVGHKEQLHFHFSLSHIGEGNGNPLQCSCLENPRDGGAWWAAVYGITQSWTQLKWLSSSSSSSRGFRCLC